MNSHIFTMAFCLKGKAMVMLPPVFSSGGYLNSERLRENRREQTRTDMSVKPATGVEEETD